MNDAPIGIFDSGVGGLTVARSILDQLGPDDEIVVGGVERPRPVLGRDHDVFEARAEAAGQLDARLDGERHSLRQRKVVAGDDVRLLVHGHPDPVAGAVDERVGHPRRGQHGSGHGVDVLGRDTRTHRRDCLLLSAL